MTKQQLIAYLDRYEDSIEIVFLKAEGDNLELLSIYSFEEEVSCPDKLFVNLTQ